MTRRKLAITTAALIGLVYLIISFPLTALFLQSEYFRFLTFEQFSLKLTKYRAPEYVFVGDSITAGGRNWGSKLGLSPIDTVNLGVSSYTVDQIHYRVDQASDMRPRYISILAGTNDLGSERYSEDAFKSDYAKIFITIDKHPQIKYYVTSVPLWRDGSHTENIQKANAFLEAETIKRPNATFIDLSSAIAESTLTDQEKYTDTVHLAPKSYDIWISLLHKNK